MNNKQYPSLYKRDSKNKILEWKAEVQNNSHNVDIMMSYGEFNGKKALRWQRDIKGKNIGKSNETTNFQQACKNVESKINNKKRNGYKELKSIIPVEDYINLYSFTKKELEVRLKQYLSENNTNLEGNLIPMKAQQYYRSKKDWIDDKGKLWKDRKYYYLLNPYVNKEPLAIITKFPCLIQPKINGVRCFIQLVNNEVKLYSKKGLEYNIPHIIDFFNINIDIFKDNDKDLIFDGELYIHNEKLEVITSAVKKYNLNTPRIVFIAFDLAITNLNTTERRKILKDKLSILKNYTNPYINLIKTFKISTDKNVQLLTDKFIKEGYEGSILRDPNSLYEFGKRPQSMTKLKRLMDDEFVIIDITAQEKDNSLGQYLCRTKKGDEFHVNPTGTTEFKKTLLYNKSYYINKKLTCWFYEYTDKGLPFHVVDTLIRDYE